jgi:sulfotransferase family protein
VTPPEDRSYPRVDFLMGMARSGTTWIGRVLSHHPELAVFGETSFFGRLQVPPRRDGLYGRRELRAVLRTQSRRDWRTTTLDTEEVLVRSYGELVAEALGDLEAPIAPAEVFLGIAAAVARSEGKPRVLEKTPHHVHWLPVIAERLPESRFVLAVRDPYEFVVSLRNLGNRLEGRASRLLDASWRHPLLNALAWRAYMRSTERALSRYPDRILVVRTEDLRSDPRAVVDRIQTFLGLEPGELPVNIPPLNSSFAGGASGQLGADDLFWLRLVAGRTLRGHGYRPPAVASAPFRTLASVLTAPVYLATTAARLPGMVRGSLMDYLARWLGVTRA